MPDMDGFELLTTVRAEKLPFGVIVLTGHGDTYVALEAMKAGADDFVTKPCEPDRLRLLVARILERRRLIDELEHLRLQMREHYSFHNMLSKNPRMRKVFDLIEQVGPLGSTVLIQGETGTGKELVARAVHDQSARATMPFVAINCGALPESLIESELFGHRKGSFTGADEHRVGLFEVADGGTLFLDEIGELPKPMQAKLLRVLESGEIRRVGENQSLIVDVRVVCATHRRLEQMVEEGEFRQDLMFRVNTFEIQLSPLRERAEDIPQLAQHLLKRFRPHLRAGDPLFTPEAMEKLQQHEWPGNVRELANAVEHASILCDELPIGAEHLPDRFGTRRLRIDAAAPNLGAPITLRDLEMQAIYQSLERNGGNKPKTAEELGISLKTLYNKLNQGQNLERTA
jgi:two-component system NtrC family response regulator